MRHAAELHVPRPACRLQFTLRVRRLAAATARGMTAIYAQDQWTQERLTLQGALRYEHAWSWFPEGENGVLAASQFLRRRSPSRGPTV